MKSHNLVLIVLLVALGMTVLTNTVPAQSQQESLLRPAFDSDWIDRKKSNGKINHGFAHQPERMTWKILSRKPTGIIMQMDSSAFYFHARAGKMVYVPGCGSGLYSEIRVQLWTHQFGL